MTNCIILHGCPSDEERAMDPEKRTYDKHWIPWMKNKLEENRIEVSTPLMPEPWSPNYETWKNKFDGLKVDKETILIGHSCSNAFLVRYLGDTQKKIKKLILVAPWVLPDKNYSEGENEMYTFDIDKNIKKRVGEIIIFTSDNEEEDGKKSAEIFQEALDGKLIELSNHGHYVLNHMKTQEFPELLKEVLK